MTREKRIEKGVKEERRMGSGRGKNRTIGIRKKKCEDGRSEERNYKKRREKAYEEKEGER